MKLKQISQIIFFLSLMLSAVGCVSVSLKQKPSEKSRVVSLKHPSAPFKEMSLEKDQTVDKSWTTPRGHTIAYYSECSTEKDPSLETVEADFANALTHQKDRIVSSTEFNQREALRSVTQGKVDGVPVQMQLLVFKKNFCTYTLMYTAQTKFYKEMEKEFETFLSNFWVN